MSTSTYTPRPTVSDMLPPTVRNALVAASMVGRPGSNERNKAIDDAITYANLHFPNLFNLEQSK